MTKYAMLISRNAALAVALTLSCAISAAAEDWPQWRGAGRLGV